MVYQIRPALVSVEVNDKPPADFKESCFGSVNNIRINASLYVFFLLF